MVSKDQPKKFAEGVCFKKIFFVFIFGCLFGYVYEVILNFVVHLCSDGTIFLERRSAVIYGPFSVIYGLGGALMTFCFARKKMKWWQILIYGGLICGICEYLTGWLQEVFTGTTSWDYSDQIFNINGRTSLFIMFIWGVICLIFIKFVYPFFSDLIEKIPLKIGNFLFWFLVVFLSIDVFISFSAVIKMNLRDHNIPSFTPYGQFLDTVYPDERVHQAYPNLVKK